MIHLRAFWLRCRQRLFAYNNPRGGGDVKELKLSRTCYPLHSKCWVNSPVYTRSKTNYTLHLILAHARCISSQNFVLRWALSRPQTDFFGLRPEAMGCEIGVCLYIWRLSFRFLSVRSASVWTAAPWILQRETNLTEYNSKGVHYRDVSNVEL